MARYEIEVYCYHPYKIAQTYSIAASDFSAAVSRAIKQYRKQKMAGKKVKEADSKSDIPLLVICRLGISKFSNKVGQTNTAAIIVC